MRLVELKIIPERILTGVDLAKVVDRFLLVAHPRIFVFTPIVVFLFPTISLLLAAALFGFTACVGLLTFLMALVYPHPASFGIGRPVGICVGGSLVTKMRLWLIAWL